MFASNQTKQTDMTLQKNERIIDPFTLWLIRITCFMIIIVISGLLLGLPLAISFGQSIFNETLLNAKQILRNFIETSLV